jgi:hypothetical protein
VLQAERKGGWTFELLDDTTTDWPDAR